MGGGGGRKAALKNSFHGTQSVTNMTRVFLNPFTAHKVLQT